MAWIRFSPSTTSFALASTKRINLWKFIQLLQNVHGDFENGTRWFSRRLVRVATMAFERFIVYLTSCEFLPIHSELFFNQPNYFWKLKPFPFASEKPKLETIEKSKLNHNDNVSVNIMTLLHRILESEFNLLLSGNNNKREINPNTLH